MYVPCCKGIKATRPCHFRVMYAVWCRLSNPGRLFSLMSTHNKATCLQILLLLEHILKSFVSCTFFVARFL